MSLECKVQIQITSLSKKEASAIQKALLPDNVKFPEGQTLQMETRNSDLLITIAGGHLSEFTHTTDEVLEHAAVALEVIQ